ncbi:MAG: hypothetical protein QOE37_593 [Microbacteriaceae bacterium]|nr:hypothetical protein [Microbacteriaceae bacterium]
MHAIGVGALIVGAALGSLSVWALLAILERTTRPARRTWTILAVALATLSLTAPLAGPVTTAAALSVALMHLGTAAVVIPLLAWTSGIDEALSRDVEHRRSEHGQVRRLERTGGVDS